MPPFFSFYDVKAFGVGQESERFLPRASQSVALPPQPSPLKLDWRLFRQEPAITVLDWLFTPSRKLEGRMHAVSLQASIHFWISPYPRLDRTVSGRNQVTKGTFIPFPSLKLISCGNLVSLRVRAVSAYPRHSNALLGPLFETNDRTP